MDSTVETGCNGFPPLFESSSVRIYLKNPYFGELVVSESIYEAGSVIE